MSRGVIGDRTSKFYQPGLSQWPGSVKAARILRADDAESAASPEAGTQSALPPAWTGPAPAAPRPEPGNRKSPQEEEQADGGTARLELAEDDDHEREGGEPPARQR